MTSQIRSESVGSEFNKWMHELTKIQIEEEQEEKNGNEDGVSILVTLPFRFIIKTTWVSNKSSQATPAIAPR